MDRKSINNNALAFIALCNEYCQALERAREADRDNFVASMLRLLPRIYISASDLKIDSVLGEAESSPTHPSPHLFRRDLPTYFRCFTTFSKP